MRRFLAVFVGLGALALLGGGAAPPSSAGAAFGPALVAPAAVVEGAVVDALTGHPVAGATVSASSGPTTSTAMDGTYGLSVSNGSVTITVRAAGYHTAALTVVVRPGGPPVNVSLQPFVYAVHGAVVDRGDSVALGGVLIVATPGDVVATTSPAGTYRLMLENGSYTLTVSAPGYQRSTLPVVVDGSPVTLYVFLSPPVPPSTSTGFSPVTIVGAGLVAGATAAVIGGWTARRRRRPADPAPDGPIAGLPSIASAWARHGSGTDHPDRGPPR